MFNLNSELSYEAASILSTYLDFPENKPVTIIDFNTHSGRFLERLTEEAKDNRHMYVATTGYGYSLEMRDGKKYERVINNEYKADSRISENAFSLAVVVPEVSPVVERELFTSMDSLIEPDFERIERDRLLKANKNSKDFFDFTSADLSEEEKEIKEEEFNKELEEAVKERRLAFRRVIREQEKRISLSRSDGYLLSRATRALAPGGVLLMVTPKEMIDTAITIRLGNQFEDIQIFKIQDEEYQDKKKCIILAKKRMTPLNDRSIGYLLAETKLKHAFEIEEIEHQEEPSYSVPSLEKESVSFFRIGPISREEVQSVVAKSNLIEHYRENHSQEKLNDKAIAPTQLHKGHIMLLLTSGHLNGYIGKGVNQHLVKGTVQKMTRTTQERDNDNNLIEKERDFYNISVNYLNADGEFHKLM